MNRTDAAKKTGFGNILKRSGAGVILQFTEVGFQFLILFVLTRGLGAEIFGDYIYAFTLVTFLVIIGQLGLEISSVRFVSSYIVEERFGMLRGYLQFVERTVLLLSVVTALLFLLGVQAFSRWMSDELVLCCSVASVLVLLYGLLQMRAGVLRGFDEVVKSKIPQTVILPSLFLAGAGLVIWLTPEGERAAWPVMAVHGAAAAVAVVVAGRWIKIARPPETRDVPPEFDRRAWLVSGGLLALFAGMMKLQAQIDIIMLGALRETAEAGVYATASRIASVPVLIMTAIYTVMSPLFARLLKSDSDSELRHLVRRSGLIVLAVSIPLILVLALVGKPVLNLLGEEFVIGYVPLLILLGGRLGFVFSGPSGVLLNMAGHEVIMTKILAGGVVLNIVLNAALIPFYGASGAAIATAVSAVLSRAALIVCVRRKLGIPCSALQPETWRRTTASRG